MSDDERLLDKARNIANAEFLEGILQKSENDHTIKVADIEVKFATNKGDNYTSDMFRIVVNFSRNNNSEVSEKKQLIVKFPPMTEGAAQDLITQSPLFETEIKMMSDTLKKMNNLFEPNARLSAQCLYFHRENPLILVIEDLSPLGYRMANQKTGLDLDHCLLALRNLARFHASSVALVEKEPHLKELYRHGTFNGGQPPEVMKMFTDSIRQFTDTVSKWEELDRKYVDKLYKLADVLFEKGKSICTWNPNEFNVINHGDFWVNNMLFRYNEQGKPTKHIFVDFQICNYSSPALDLVYFFNTSVTDDMLMEYESLFLEQYRETLSTTMMRLGCRTKTPTRDELKTAMREKAFMGMVATLMILPFILVEKDDAFRLSEMMTDDGKFVHPGINSQLYRPILNRRIKMFDQMGLLD